MRVNIIACFCSENRHREFSKVFEMEYVPQNGDNFVISIGDFEVDCVVDGNVTIFLRSDNGEVENYTIALEEYNMKDKYVLDIQDDLIEEGWHLDIKESKKDE